MAIVGTPKDKMMGQSATFNRDWTRTYTRVLQVITNSVNDGAQAVIQGCGVSIGDHYRNLGNTETDLRAFAMSITATENSDDGKSWDVTIEYGPYDAAQWPENPLLAPPDVEWGFAPYTRPVDIDVNDVAVLNTAGDPFDPSIEIEDPRVTLTIVGNEATFDPSRAYSYRNAINSDTFMGSEPGTVKVTRLSGSRQWDSYLSSIGQNGGFYWTVTYEFEFNPDGWKKKVLNQGLRKKNQSTGKAETILISGTAATDPVRLDEDGLPLDPDDAGSIFLEFNVYTPMSFAALNLDYPGPS